MKPLIVANWKCNPATLQEAKRIFGSIKRGLKNVKNAEIVICPPFVYLFNLQLTRPTSPASELAGGRATHNLRLGAQNCFYEQRGAFTGEVSPQQLSNLGCKYVIIGHSERRRYFKETDETINKKMKAAIDAKLKIIFCIGETEEEREKERVLDALNSQIKKGLKKVSKKEMKNIIIAYEPRWAIGTGRPCPLNEAQTMNLLIKKIIARFYSRSISEKVPILYGGSVNSKNGGDYVKEAYFQGLLVGGASLDAKEFIRIIKAAAKDFPSKFSRET